MPSILKPRPYPLIVRVILVLFALGLITLTLNLMTVISQPSQFINAYKVVLQGPGHTSDLRNLPIMSFSKFLYLVGPILPAATEKNSQPLFSPTNFPVLVPAVFTDNYGAVEITAHVIPLTAQLPEKYYFNMPLHIIGWRISETALRLFALAHSQKELLDLVSVRVQNWKRTLFFQGLLLAFLVFVIFWLMNISLLSNPYLQMIQLLVVNLIFLVLFYSVLYLAGYPMLSTLIATGEILILTNVVFLPLTFLLRYKRPA